MAEEGFFFGKWGGSLKLSPHPLRQVFYHFPKNKSLSAGNSRWSTNCCNSSPVMPSELAAQLRHWNSVGTGDT